MECRKRSRTLPVSLRVTPVYNRSDQSDMKKSPSDGSGSGKDVLKKNNVEEPLTVDSEGVEGSERETEKSPSSHLVKRNLERNGSLIRGSKYLQDEGKDVDEVEIVLMDEDGKVEREQEVDSPHAEKEGLEGKKKKKKKKKKSGPWDKGKGGHIMTKSGETLSDSEERQESRLKAMSSEGLSTMSSMSTDMLSRLNSDYTNESDVEEGVAEEEGYGSSASRNTEREMHVEPPPVRKPRSSSIASLRMLSTTPKGIGQHIMKSVRRMSIKDSDSEKSDVSQSQHRSPRMEHDPTSPSTLSPRLSSNNSNSSSGSNYNTSATHRNATLSPRSPSLQPQTSSHARSFGYAEEGKWDHCFHEMKDPNSRDFKTLQTYLHLSSLQGNYLATESLLSLGCDVNSKDCWEWTPLHCASHGRYIEVRESNIGKIRII